MTYLLGYRFYSRFIAARVMARSTMHARHRPNGCGTATTASRRIATSAGDENRASIGAAYWWRGYNANIKAAYTRIDPSGLDRQNEVTLQLQRSTLRRGDGSCDSQK